MNCKTPPKFLFAGILLWIFSTTAFIAQVGINTSSPANGALLDINSSNKGFLLPKVTLTSTNDNTTITPTATEGLMVYNTVTAGALPIQVTPGFYYWNGSTWQRFYNRGYGVKFNQTGEATASTLTTIYTAIPGLSTGIITVPYSGTYQIKVEATYAAGTLVSTASEGVGQASISLDMVTNVGVPVKVKESYVTSTSKRINGTTINSLPKSATIIYTVDLDVTNVYQFTAYGRQWSRTNVNTGTYGKDTSGYSGSSSVNTAQRGSLTITLMKQQ